jgi:O-antigen/teichoic acid export membrane protein
MPGVTAIAVLSGPIVALWLGPKYAEAAGLATVAVLNVAANAPLGVGSQMLVGLGRARAVLRCDAISVAVNVVASVSLVHAVGIVGTFIGSIIGSLVLTALLLPPVLEETGLGLRHFTRSSLFPALPPSVAMAAAAGAVLLLPLGSFLTVLLGGLFGLVVFILVARQWSLEGSEVGELRALLQRATGQPPPGAHPETSAPGA